MSARIYKPSKTAMQSGLGNSKDWVLDYEPEAPRTVEPLMGWTSSGDMRQQLRLRFRQQRRGDRLLRAPWHCLPGVRCQGAAGAARHVLFRQFRPSPPRRLDALNGRCHKRKIWRPRLDSNQRPPA